MVYAGSYDHSLYALDAHTGISFSFTTGGLLASEPVVANGVVLYVGSDTDHTLYALDASTGSDLMGATPPMEKYSFPHLR